MKTFWEAIDSPQSSCWMDAMHDEMALMCRNNVWDLIEFLDGCRPIDQVGF